MKTSDAFTRTFEKITRVSTIGAEIARTLMSAVAVSALAVLADRQHQHLAHYMLLALAFVATMYCAVQITNPISGFIIARYSTDVEGKDLLGKRFGRTVIKLIPTAIAVAFACYFPWVVMGIVEVGVAASPFLK